MIILSLISGKGGVGKTTATITLAIAYQAMGQRVHVIDMDPNAFVVGWSHARAQNQDVNGTPFTVSQAENADAVVDQLDTLERDGVDIVLIDTEGTAAEASRIYMANSTLVLIPMTDSAMDATMAGHAGREVEAVNAQLDYRVPYAFFFSRSSTCIKTKSKAMIENSLREGGVTVLEAELRELSAYKNMHFGGRTFAELQDMKKAQRDRALQNAEALAREIYTVATQPFDTLEDAA